MATRKYDSTVARIAGNITAGLLSQFGYYEQRDPYVVARAVSLARMIVAETERTEPVNPVDSVDTRIPSGR